MPYLKKQLARTLPWVLGMLLPWVAVAQTLVITNGTRTIPALSNLTVTLTDHCALWLTSGTAPLVNCTVNLNSQDAWLFLPALPPSRVVADYLGQIRVNGANAIPDSNVRVVQYAMGAVVIPHSRTLAPLEVFGGPYFTGTSRRFPQYLFFNSPALLGPMNRAISSFKLKRGYLATLAQNADGTGLSRVFIAQDDDLEVALLPPGLDNAVSFVRVVPWRWSGKKGWAGGKEPLVNPLWHYDWDNATISSRDIEYVPMRHNEYWNSYANIANKRDSTHALGFNEPDRPDQANMTVDQALAQWPNLLASGLRLGSPAPSDAAAGLGWLYDFIDAADARNYRVDYVAVHFYKGGWSAGQYYNWLRDIHVRTGRPIWITEWNNGANWTCCEPTLQSQATIIGEFIDMLDHAPFVERYAIYNWVGANRELVTNGALKPAGVVYRDNDSPLAYTQTLSSAGTRSIVQLPFENSALDTSGHGNGGMTVGTPAFEAGRVGRAIGLDGSTQFVRLPPNLAHAARFSFAGWVYWQGGGNWQRILDFGNDTSHYLFLTPSSGNGTLRFAICNGGSEQIVEAPRLTIGQWQHVAVTLAGNTARIYVNGVLRGSSTGFSIAPSQFNPTLNYLGESQFIADPLFRGKLDEVRIYDEALTAAQVAALMNDTPPAFTAREIDGGVARQGVFYSQTIAGAAVDPDAGDVVTYRKASGPAWLTVAANGELSGTPGLADEGLQEFTVCARDTAGASDYAVVTIDLTVATDPPLVSFLVSRGVLKLAWPASHQGWRLEVQTGSLTAGPEAVWTSIPNSDLVHEWTIPIETTGDAFFRLVSP